MNPIHLSSSGELIHPPTLKQQDRTAASPQHSKTATLQHRAAGIL